MRILVGAAVVPALILMFLVYRMDRIEKEPVGILIKLFLFGVLSTLPAIFLERIAGRVLDANPLSNTGRAFFDAFLCTALVEELCKYGALYIGSWRSPYFTHRFDGLLYSVCVTMGFAAAENLLYVLRIGLSVAPVRAVFSVPGHLAFGIAMGVHYANAKNAEARSDGRRGVSHALALLFPILLHGFFDFCLMSGSWFLSILFFLFAVALDLYSFFTVRRMSRADASIHTGM